MTDFIGTVPTEAARLAEQYAATAGSQFLELWDARESTASTRTGALEQASKAHGRDRRPRCVVPTSAGYVVYPLRRMPSKVEEGVRPRNAREGGGS